MTWYSIIHGPEFWLGVAGLCGIAAVGVSVGSIIYVIKQKTDPKNQNGRKNNK